MYRFYLNQTENNHHYAEMIREFLGDSEFEIIPADLSPSIAEYLGDRSFLLNADGEGDRDSIKREIYQLLSTKTGRKPGWGTLTGVRPLKPAKKLAEESGSAASAVQTMKEKYLLSEEKAKLLREVLDYQEQYVEAPNPHLQALYIGIPFCPSKCSYCAFGSSVFTEQGMNEYLPCLHREIEALGKLYREHVRGRDLSLESIYFGGGTPTTLTGEQLRELFRKIEDTFGYKLSSIETTVEAGRPDTITKDRLEAMADAGIRRISINPQSMHQVTLEAIGRSHTPEEIREAFRLASKYSFKVVNSDLIAGLPGENTAMFLDSLEQMIALGANNITIHTLSVKRGSRLKEEDPEYYRRGEEEVIRMLDAAGKRLRAEGFRPYYLYRQKHQMGSLENVGWCLPDTHSLYNIRIMEEKQTIYGLGAGAIGKRYDDEREALLRVPNVSNYTIYCERIDEMLERKKQYFGG